MFIFSNKEALKVKFRKSFISGKQKILYLPDNINLRKRLTSIIKRAFIIFSSIFFVQETNKMKDNHHNILLSILDWSLFQDSKKL